MNEDFDREKGLDERTMESKGGARDIQGNGRVAASI